MQISSLLKKLDRLGNKYTLNVNQLEEKRTLFGGILWLVGMLIILSYSFTVITSYYNLEKMRPDEEIDEQFMGVEVDVQKQDLLPMFLVSNSSTTAFLTHDAIPKLFQVTYQVSVRGRPDIPSIFFDVVPCNTLPVAQIERFKDQVDNFEQFGDLFDQHMFCVKSKDVTAKLFGSPEGFMNTSYSNLAFKPCLSTVAGCRADSDLSNIIVNILTVNKVLTLANKKSPVRYLWTFEQGFYIMKSQEQRLRTFLMKTQIYDTRGFPFKSYLVEEFTSVQKQERIYLERESVTMCEPEKPCPWYFTVVTTSGGRTVRKYRVYQTLAEALGTIGGFRTIVLVVLVFINYYSNSGSAEATLVEHVYGLKIQDSYHLSCCRKRKSPEQDSGDKPVSLGTIELAYASIMKTLDVRTIVREISMVKVISLALLSRQQHAVVPWAIVNSDMKLIMETKKSKEQAAKVEKSQSKATLGDSADSSFLGDWAQPNPQKQDGSLKHKREIDQNSLMGHLQELESPNPENIKQTITELDYYEAFPDPVAQHQHRPVPNNRDTNTLNEGFNQVLRELLRDRLLMPR